MALAIAILVFAVLLVGFLLLTGQEKKRGTRVLASARQRLDTRVASATHTLREIDIGAFLWHALRAGVEWVAHELVHVVLLGVRTLERLLTRAARELRGRRAVGDTDLRIPFLSGVERIRKALWSLKKKKEEVDVSGTEKTRDTEPKIG